MQSQKEEGQEQGQAQVDGQDDLMRSIQRSEIPAKYDGEKRPFLAAVKAGDIETIKHVLRWDGKAVGKASINAAIKNNDGDMLDLLLRNAAGKPGLFYAMRDTWLAETMLKSPLFAAVHLLNCKACKLMLDRGYDPKQKTTVGTLITTACLQGFHDEKDTKAAKDTINVLIEHGADIKIETSTLFHAVMHRRMPLARFLFEMGVPTGTAKDQLKQSRDDEGCALIEQMELAETVKEKPEEKKPEVKEETRWEKFRKGP
jgi:hypothetical protein